MLNQYPSYSIFKLIHSRKVINRSYVKNDPKCDIIASFSNKKSRHIERNQNSVEPSTAESSASASIKNLKIIRSTVFTSNSLNKESSFTINSAQSIEESHTRSDNKIEELFQKASSCKNQFLEIQSSGYLYIPCIYKKYIFKHIRSH
jgi:hypothetical protein